MLFGIDRQWLYVFAAFFILLMLIIVTNTYYQRRYTGPAPLGQVNGIKRILDSEELRRTGNEVFHIGNNSFTYPQAKCLCKSYGGDLATRGQVTDAFNKGANWCSYGWSKGQQALYPIQKGFWDELQKGPASKRDDCGNPGINGGLFSNPNLKFGVNCYGNRPEGSVPRPLDPMESCNLIKQQDTDRITSFNKKKWSMYS